MYPKKAKFQVRIDRIENHFVLKKTLIHKGKSLEPFRIKAFLLAERVGFENKSISDSDLRNTLINSIMKLSKDKQKIVIEEAKRLGFLFVKIMALSILEGLYG